MIILSLPRLGGERSFVICAVYTQVSRISHGTDKRIITNTNIEEGPSLFYSLEAPGTRPSMMTIIYILLVDDFLIFLLFILNNEQCACGRLHLRASLTCGQGPCKGAARDT